MAELYGKSIATANPRPDVSGLVGIQSSDRPSGAIEGQFNEMLCLFDQIFGRIGDLKLRLHPVLNNGGPNKELQDKVRASAACGFAEFVAQRNQQLRDLREELDLLIGRLEI